LPETAEGLPELPPIFWRTIEAALPHLGIELTAGARGAIDAQARLLLAWNAAINLTALRVPEQVARGHVLDSLAALPVLRRLAVKRFLDLGSGAGYPGLPLAVALPASHCALVESVRKKARFLDFASRSAFEAMRQAGEVEPALEALPERAEDLADEPDQRDGWDAVLARAVGSLAEVFELSLPLARVGGHVVAWKRALGDGSLATEIDDARPVSQAAGGSRPRVERLPGLAASGMADHVLIVVRKVRPTPERYPRSPAERRRAHSQRLSGRGRRPS
jgi:16S rRNA (guanine527-N7)-methyltransferase